MKKLTDKEIRRLLSARGTPEPPGGLADRRIRRRAIREALSQGLSPGSRSRRIAGCEILKRLD